MVRTQRINPGLIVAAALLAVTVLLVDLSLPLGVAGGVPYVALVLVGWWFHGRSDIFVLATVSSVLTAAGYLFSPEGGLPWMVLTNRVLAFFAIWVTAVLLFTAKRAEEILRASEERYRRVYENTPVMLHSIDREGRLLSVSDHWLEVLGYRRDEVIGRKVMTFMTKESARDVSIPRLPEFIKTGRTTDLPLKFVKKNGEVIDVPLSAVAERDAGGKFVRSLSVLTDVTERKRAEERFRAYFDLPLVGAAIYAPDKRWIEVNDKLCDLFHYTRDELMQLTWVDITHPDDLAENVRLFDRALSGKGPDSYSMEKRFIRKDGEIRHASISVQSVRHPDGTPNYFILLVQDITERKRAEEALRKAHDELELRVGERTRELTGEVAERRRVEEELRLRNQELLTLHRISEISLQPHTLTEAFQSIVDVISKDTHFPDVSIELYEREYNGAAHSGIKGVPVYSGGDSRRVPMEDPICCRSIVRSGGPMRKVPATKGTRRARKLERQKMETIIPVPMVMGDTVIGVLTLAHPEKIKLEERLPEWAATLANHLAALIDRMGAEKVLHKRVDLYRELSKRVETAGVTSFHDHELMELLLLLTAPSNDAAALTKRLMSGLGGFAGAVNAEPRAIKEIHGGDEAIVAFAAVREATIRLAREELTKSPVFDSWDKLITYCRIGMAHENTEHFRVLYLNRGNTLIADDVGQKGTVDQAPFYPREVVKRALELSATALILVHNHPSGDPTPSGDDIEITRDLMEAVDSLGIVLHDHLIISRSTHYSFKNMGLL